MATATKTPKAATLNDKVAEYRKLILKAQELEEEIKTAVLEHSDSMAFAGCMATYRKANPRTDYEALAQEAAVNTDGFEETKVNWRKACEAAGSAITETLKAKHTKDSGPSVSLKLT